MIQFINTQHTTSFTEESYENAVVSLMEALGYEHVYGPDVERDYHVPFYEE